MTALPTVAPVTPTSTIHRARQHEQMRRGLGRIAELDSQPDVPGRATLELVHSAAPPAPGSFPCGAETRRLDSSLRLKFAPGRDSLCELVGWHDGVLDSVCIDGWMILTQRPEQVGAARGRNSAYAGFTVDAHGLERICLRPAHVQNLGVVSGAAVLVAAFPDAAAVVIVDPVQVLGLAPSKVRSITPGADAPVLTPVPSIQLTRTGTTQ